MRKKKMRKTKRRRRRKKRKKRTGQTRKQPNRKENILSRKCPCAADCLAEIQRS